MAEPAAGGAAAAAAAAAERVAGQSRLWLAEIHRSGLVAEARFSGIDNAAINDYCNNMLQCRIWAEVGLCKTRLEAEEPAAHVADWLLTPARAQTWTKKKMYQWLLWLKPWLQLQQTLKARNEDQQLLEGALAVMHQEDPDTCELHAISGAICARL